MKVNLWPDWTLSSHFKLHAPCNNFHSMFEEVQYNFGEVLFNRSKQTQPGVWTTLIDDELWA